MRVAVELVVLAVVSVLVRSSGYAALADAIAMGYLAHFTMSARRSLFARSTLGAVSVHRFQSGRPLDTAAGPPQPARTVTPIL